MSTQPTAQISVKDAAENGSDSVDAGSMRERIRALALDLLIQFGYRGMSFGDLATALNTTRANIHYHFGNKQSLVEDVIVAYVADTLAETAAVFNAPNATFVEKIERVVAYSRRRYEHYNAPGAEGRPWSLIARMRQDSTFLTPKGQDALQGFADALHAVILAAVVKAQDEGEFAAGMPAEDVALQLFSIANSASPITQDAGSFDRLEQLYMGFTRIVVQAFGTSDRR